MISMNARDTLSAKMAKCFVTINGKRFNFMNAINLEARIDKKKVVVPRLGAMMDGNKSVSMAGKGKALMHFNQSVFREALEEYQDSGEDLYFEIQVTNEDPTTSVGKQTVILIDCNTDGGIITKFDAAGDYLDEEMDFTFEGFKIPEKFKTLSGMM